VVVATLFAALLDHQATVGGFVTGQRPSRRRGVSAQAMMGDKAAARKSYDDFQSIWKDADADIPIFKQAKAGYAGPSHISKRPLSRVFGIEPLHSHLIGPPSPLFRPQLAGEPAVRSH